MAEKEVIKPPPEVLAILDKTASFVARSQAGAQFEIKLREKEGKNPKFSFLLPDDAYRPYYLERVQAYREGRAEDVLRAAESMSSKAQGLDRGEIEQDVEPQRMRPFDFLYDFGSEKQAELDRIKLTALYAARHGKKFVEDLRRTESSELGKLHFIFENDPQFLMFASLVSQYKIILEALNNNSAELLSRCIEWSKSIEPVKKDVRARLEYQAYLKATQEKKAQDAEKERLQYAAIDWHDYVLLETVLIDPLEAKLQDLPAPLSRADLEFLNLASQRADMLELSQAKQPKHAKDECSKKRKLGEGDLSALPEDADGPTSSPK